VGLFAALAQQIGVEVDLKGIKPADFKIPSRAEVEAEIERRAQQLVEQDPRVQKSLADEAIGMVEREFRSLEEARGVKLAARDREIIMQASLDAGGAPLDLVYDALLARRQAQLQSRESVRAASTVDGRSAVDIPAAPTTKKMSVAQALEAALAAPK
jgi:hypothetical protein